MGKLLTNLRTQFLILLLLVAVPLSVMTLRSGLEQRQQAALEAQDEILRLARIAAQNQEYLLEQTRGFLLALSHTVGNDLKSISDCQGVFEHLSKAHFPYYTGFYIADLNGNLLCNSPGETPRIDVCEHYAELIHATDFVVSDYHLCKNSGRGVISIGYPILDDFGRAIGVANAGVDLEWFNKLAEQSELPEGSELIVFNDDRTVLVHYPNPEIWVGRLMPNSELTHSMLEQTEGTTQGISFDGIRRLYAFVPMWSGEQKVILAIGVSTDYAYGPANRSTLLNLGVIALVTIAAVAIAWRLGETHLLHPMRVIVNTTKSLADGNLSVRTQLPYNRGELGTLGHAVDQLADALVQHEAERDQNEKAIQEYADSLEKSNRELRDFNSIASHDLQEPLRKLQMYSDLLMARYGHKLDENGKKYLSTLSKGAERMQNLILDLLAYSQVTTRANPFQLVQLNEILMDVVSDLEAQITETGAKIRVDDLPELEADPAQLTRLFQNLLGNSIKFHEPDVAPEIRVYSEMLDGGKPQVKIYVADNGIGFDEKYLERIFQPFESLHKAEEYPGTGIGLAICRKIVERHGGSITAQSKPDQGAVFVVTLPMYHPDGGS